MELLRLIKLKQYAANENVKMVMSIDCAATLCGSDFDHDQALKLSGIRKSEYAKKKQLFESLLDLAKKVNLNEICAQLELNDLVKSDAKQLLVEYKKRPTFKDDISSAHCIAMAIYQSGKLRKVKLSKIKSKLITISKLDTGRWKKFEEEWDSWISQDSPLSQASKPKKTSADSPDDTCKQKKSLLLTQMFFNDRFFIFSVDQNPHEQSASNGTQRIESDAESYEDWRDRMIRRAKCELEKREQNNTRMIPAQ